MSKEDLVEDGIKYTVYLHKIVIEHFSTIFLFGFDFDKKNYFRLWKK